MGHEHETEVDTAPSSSKKFSAVGGFLGTVLGSRKGPVGAVAGGLIGGTLGYLAGASFGQSSSPTPDVEPEPVSIDVAEPDTE